METLSDKLNSIELKVRQLALKLERLQNENAELLEENKVLKKKVENRINKTTVLEEKLTKTQVALDKRRDDDPKSSKRMRKEVDQYIKEIDKCIEWLQNN